ncbi:hypothetical protein GQF42_39145 [Streptomyces broussonetiae]|uniref:Uncharacterized protein n=1 Tax=Streptomyces broussonetiae TaxID=2686304 RepID=A0A6I6NHQ5_9ACTN|nr:hypothetical protein [Streptomyces broussonetiae]QHA08485.1 hypothetical protein GQF42_39145 [Streptomyces broussonetiae]
MRRLPEERARPVPAAAGRAPARRAGVRALGGGTCTTVGEPRLTDGVRHVPKTAPTGPGLRRESRLLAAEGEFCRAVAKAGVPAPRTVHADGGPAVRHTLEARCPGSPWGDSTARAGQAVPRREPGSHAGRPHRIAGPGPGYLIMLVETVPWQGGKGRCPPGTAGGRARPRRRPGRDHSTPVLAHSVN